MMPPRILAGGLMLTCACAVMAQEPSTCPAAVANLFPVQSWQPPPPPPPPPRKPEPPKAPPLPFKYLGQLQEDRGIVLFLEHGKLTLVARAGETVAGNWRIEKITPTQAVFNYQPLDQSQTLTLRTRP
jgi:hypothetical protein